MYISSKILINRPDYFGYTPLMRYMDSNATLEGVMEMVDEGASVEHKAHDGETPLTLAYRSAPFAVVRFLIMKGADTKYAVEHERRLHKKELELASPPKLEEVKTEEEEAEKPNKLRMIVDRLGIGAIVVWLAFFASYLYYFVDVILRS